MEFGEWEVDNEIWLKEVDKDKVQESVLERRCRKAHEAAAANPAAPLTQPGQEEALRIAADATKTFEPEEDQELILLVDAVNGFNNSIHKRMPWAVHNHWSRLANFTFDLYRHEIRLVVCVP